MKWKPILTIALIFLSVLSSTTSEAQLYEVPLASRIDHSELIVEGRVVDAQ